jgi:hypothetical protein
VNGVWVVESTGGIAGVAADLVHAVRWALAEHPSGVVCSFTDQNHAGDLEPYELLCVAGLGWFVAEWPAVPIAIGSPDSELLSALGGAPGGEYLIFASGLLAAWSEVCRTLEDRTAETAEAVLRLPPHPVAIRAARQFLVRTCVEWRFLHAATAGGLLVHELVSNVLGETYTDIEVRLTRHDERLRTSVRYGRGRDPLGTYRLAKEPVHWHMPLVDAFASASGQLPAADGGRQLWAVLDV